jgi:hypothetical protein
MVVARSKDCKKLPVFPVERRTVTLLQDDRLNPTTR